MEKIKKYSATMAKLAYSDNNNYIANELVKYGIVFLKSFVFGETEGYIATCEDGQVIVLRGSDKKNDWGTNFDCTLIETDLGWVHEGFYNEINEHYKEYLDLIEDIKIFVIGHSSGGAKSIILGKMLKIRKDINAPFFAFETPRVSNTHYFNTNGVSTINYSDPVSRVPFKFLNFRHNGIIIYFTKTGNARKGARFIHLLMDYFTGFNLQFKMHEPALVELLWLRNWNKIKLMC
jgi:hypothetical protein